MKGTERLPELEVLIQELKPRLEALVVCISRSWGGLEQVAASDAVDVAAQGLDAGVLCLEGSPIHEHLRGNTQIKLLPIDFRPRNYFDLSLRKKLHDLITKAGINLVHVHQPSLLGSIVPALVRFPGVALVVSRHIMNNHDKKGLLHRMIYSRVDALVAMSQTLKENILATHGVRERKVKVIHLGLDFDRFDPEKVNPESQRAAWGADSDTTVIGMVGRIDPAKGQATFIKAAAGIMKRLREGEKIKFVIVGEETLGSSLEHLKDLQAMVRQFHLEDHVVFAGYQENIPEIMKSFDIFVMPSRQEAFGLVAIEAMAMQCPIVISSGGSAHEIVGHEDFGLTVRPDDAFDLQQKLRELLDHPETRAKMGSFGREHVKENYDRAIRLRQTLQLYDRCLRRRESL